MDIYKPTVSNEKITVDKLSCNGYKQTFKFLYRDTNKCKSNSLFKCRITIGPRKERLSLSKQKKDLTTYVTIVDSDQLVLQRSLIRIYSCREYNVWTINILLANGVDSDQPAHAQVDQDLRWSHVS